MIDIEKIHLASSDGRPIYLLPEMSNRHGIISGATGTGKTVTLRVLAEDFSTLGVPVFMPDMKGELSGLLRPMSIDEPIRERIEATGIRENYEPEDFPVLFWDLYGESGIPLRCSPSQMGPALLSRMLGLNETQSGVLDVIFRVADERALPLLDFKDLQSMLRFVNENRSEISKYYGNVAPSSITSIMRRLLRFEDEGAEPFFGEPTFELADFFVRDTDGRGMIHILQASRLMSSPLLYSSFMLWMLSELFEKLPEVGDTKVPTLAFFFDEAHLLFDALPKTLSDKLEQVIRMIRSKGVAIFFVTQSIQDLPDTILAQLGNRIQHGMRAYTPRELSLLKHTADSFRANPAFDTEEALRELSIGEALISTLDSDGVPTMVERASVLPPRSSLDRVDSFTLHQSYESHDLFNKYAEVLDRESAYEILEGLMAEAAQVDVEDLHAARLEQEVASDLEAGQTSPLRAEEAAERERYESARITELEAEREAALEALRKAEEAAEKAARAAELQAEKAIKEAQREAEKAAKAAEREAEKAAKAAEREAAAKAKASSKSSSSNRLSPVDRLTNSAFSAVGREIGRRITRGVLGNLLK